MRSKKPRPRQRNPPCRKGPRGEKMGLIWFGNGENVPAIKRAGSNDIMQLAAGRRIIMPEWLTFFRRNSLRGNVRKGFEDSTEVGYREMVSLVKNSGVMINSLEANQTQNFHFWGMRKERKEYLWAYVLCANRKGWDPEKPISFLFCQNINLSPARFHTWMG